MKDLMTLSIKQIVIAILASVALASCAGAPQPVALAPTIELAELTSLPVPDTVTSQVIGPNEQIDIAVAGSDMLSGTFQTDTKGYISYPLVGDLYLAGKSSGQAGKLIADRLRGVFVIDPQVNVRPTVFQPPSISVGGQITNPGTYPSATSPSLIRAVNNAGGLNRYGQLDDIVIMRTVNEQRYIGVYNLGAIQRGNYPDPAIFPNDIIIVGDSLSRRRLEQFLQFVPLASTAAILIERSIKK